MNLQWFMSECGEFFKLCGENESWHGGLGQRRVDRGLFGLQYGLFHATYRNADEVQRATFAYDAVVENFRRREILIRRHGL